MKDIVMRSIDKEVLRREISQLVEESLGMSPDNVAEYLVDKGLADYTTAFREGAEAAVESINRSKSPYLKSYLGQI